MDIKDLENESLRLVHPWDTYFHKKGNIGYTSFFEKTTSLFHLIFTQLYNKAIPWFSFSYNLTMFLKIAPAILRKFSCMG